MFTWIPIHKEAIQRILQSSQEELLAVLREMKQRELKVADFNDQNPEGNTVPLDEIDPFTFMAVFNRQIKRNNKQKLWHFLKDKWELSSAVPDDVGGIPVLNNLKTWFFPYAYLREPQNIPDLWDLARTAANKGVDHIDENLFNRCLSYDDIAIAKLTIGLFWINPENYLPADGKTVEYGKAKGVSLTPRDYRTYKDWTTAMASRLSGDFAQLSHNAHLHFEKIHRVKKTKKKAGKAPSTPNEKRYWTYSPGRQAEDWKEFYEQGIMALKGTEMPDLHQFQSKEEIHRKLLELHPDSNSKPNRALALWQFARKVEKGDIVFAKKGGTKIIGYGIVEGEYEYDATRTHSRHIRKVKWIKSGEWELVEGRMALKTLTNITRYPKFVELLCKTVGNPSEICSGASVTINYWWLYAKPDIWSFDTLPVNERSTFSSRNEKGNHRQIIKYFREVKPGDIVVGYDSGSEKSEKLVKAICRITRELHDDGNGENFELEKIEHL